MTVPVDETQWHQIDLYLKTESSSGALDGVARWWVDGTQYFSKTDCGEFPETHSWVMGIASPLAGDATEYGHVYVDDVAVWDIANPPEPSTTVTKYFDDRKGAMALNFDTELYFGGMIPQSERRL